MTSELSELDYLRQIELLARDVTDRAFDEGWLSYPPDPSDATSLQRAVNELARTLRAWHFPGDGCVEEDRTMLKLGGAALVTPQTAGVEVYRKLCERLGVEDRPQGWSLWFTWDDGGRAHTMVTTLDDTTRALLDAWSHGRDANPARPVRAQIAAVARGWIGPLTRSPEDAARRGLGGR